VSCTAYLERNERTPLDILPFALLLFVRSDIDLAAAVDARIPGKVRAAVDRRSVTVADAAGEACAACIDSGRIRRDLKVRRI